MRNLTTHLLHSCLYVCALHIKLIFPAIYMLTCKFLVDFFTSSHFFLFLHSIYYPRTPLALPPSSNSDPGSHSRPSSPLPTTVRDFIFYRENKSAFSSLVDSCRIVPTNAARRSQQLIIVVLVVAVV